MRAVRWIPIALLAAACAPPSEEGGKALVRAEPEQQIRGEEIAYQSGGVTLNGYLAYDAAQRGARPGVLVAHEWWGHNDYARQRALMLAEMGYTALALDMYGEGKQAEHPEDAQKFVQELASQMDVAVSRFDAARALLAAQPTTDPQRIAAIGYCFGGAMVLHMARIGADLDAVASFHGDLAPLATAEPGTVTARILVLHGADDPFVSAEQVEAFKREMSAVGARMEFVDYPGAVHSFTNPAADEIGARFDLPLAYNAAADEQSWARLTAFLAEAFGD